MTNISVIKLGGSLLDDGKRRREILTDIADRWNRGESMVLVHGGGKHIDAALARLGIPKRTHAGLRITDAQTLEVVVGVLAGTVNKGLVSELSSLGVRAAGISGLDAATVVAEFHPPIGGVDLGHVGRVVSANRALLRAMLNYGTLPVVSSIAQGPAGVPLNVNADSFAAAIAVAVEASSLTFFTDVPGFLNEAGSVVPTLHATDVEKLIAGGSVTGGMRPKLEAALNALRSGVGAIAIGDTANKGTNLIAA